MRFFTKTNHSIMSEGLFAGLFADLDMAFFKSKRGLLKVAQMVSISAHIIRFNVFFFSPPSLQQKQAE